MSGRATRDWARWIAVTGVLALGWLGGRGISRAAPSAPGCKDPARCLALAQAMSSAGLRGSAALWWVRLAAVAPRWIRRAGRALVAARADRPPLPRAAAIALGKQLAASTPPSGASTALFRIVGAELLRLGRTAAARRVLSRGRGPRSDYLSGLSWMAKPADHARARAAFAAALATAPRGNLRDLAVLALARLSAAAGSRARARRLYRAVSSLSPAFVAARQELAWLLLLEGRPRVALAQTLALRSAAWRKPLRADQRVVEAAALLALCRYSAARQVVASARRGLRARLREVTDFLARPGGEGGQAGARHRARNFLPSAKIRRLYYRHATSSIAGASARLAASLRPALLSDPAFRRAVFAVARLRAERQRVVRLRRVDAALRGRMEAAIAADLLRARSWAGAVVVARLVRLRDELRQLLQRAGEIAFELAAARDRRRRPSDARPAPAPAARAGATAALRSGPAGLRWPFVGAAWPDEVGRIVIRLRSRCAVGSSRRTKRARPSHPRRAPTSRPAPTTPAPASRPSSLPSSRRAPPSPSS